MAVKPKPPPPPPPSRRAVAAAATQREIVDAARRLFLARGYVATTIEAIAAEAGVSLQTVYNAVGSKRVLLERVHDLIAAGPQAPTPVPLFMQERVAREEDAEGIVRVLADWFVEVHPRFAPVARVIAEAAGADAEVAAYDQERAARRYRNYHHAARAIGAHGALAAGLGEPEVAATIWALGHPGVYRFLVEEQGWDLARYRDWLERGFRAVLLAPTPRRASRRSVAKVAKVAKVDRARATTR